MTELINSVWIIVCNPCAASEYINLIPLLGPLSRWCGNASSYTPEHHLTTLGLTYKMDVKYLQLSLLALVTLCFTFLFQKGEYNSHLCIYRTHLSVERSIYSFFSPAFYCLCAPKMQHVHCSTSVKDTSSDTVFWEGGFEGDNRSKNDMQRQPIQLYLKWVVSVVCFRIITQNK